MKKQSFFDTILKWIKFLADVIPAVKDKYNEHFKTDEPTTGQAENVVQNTAEMDAVRTASDTTDYHYKNNFEADAKRND